MKKELAKAYEPQKYEDKIYKNWEDSGFFKPENLKGEEYSIMMPPPNVTGVLHLGHALENTLMDVMTRFERMQGKKVLLLPGTDHAAVATQARVENNLAEEGIENPRELYGREKLLEIIREYAEDSKKTIIKQIKKMGTSCDWDRLAYTFDDERSLAVRTTFKKMYDDGLIYRGYRVVNWSVKGQSTCSDDELVHIDREAKMYYFKYHKDFPITIATTRPETKLGDTAVAVHPEGKFKKYIGQEFDVKDVGQKGHILKIKIIGDEHVEASLGTGALGVTPAHSGVDFEMYEKQKAEGNEIGLIQVIGQDGKMTKDAGKEFSGLNVLEAREKFVKYLKDHDLLEKEEEITQTVGTSDRFGDVVEALPMTQWFVAVNKKIPGKNKTLKEIMKEAVETGLGGDGKKQVKINPERFEKVYYNWIDNLRDWCISRQVWWGHQIPVWYKGEELYCGVNAPEGDGWAQDEDTLDTWFSSGLWTFSTLGWPNQTKDLKDFHPTNWMQMGHEILFFWMARMILFSGYLLDDIPFKDVYIHGMLRDKDGKKFSKSAKNGIDPLEVIEKYGTDALRYSLISGISPGNDSRFYYEKVEGAQHLTNKLWNMVRFMLMNIDEPKIDIKKVEAKTDADNWILYKLDEARLKIDRSFKSFDFSVATDELRSFTWDDLADNYLEYAKIEGDKSEILNYILNNILKLWHPFMPFMTEVIWKEIYGEDKNLIVEKWPKLNLGLNLSNLPNTTGFQTVQSIVSKIRNIRSENGIEPAKKIDVKISAGDKIGLIEQNLEIIKRHWTNIENLEIGKKLEKPAGWLEFVEGGVNVFVDLSGAIDLDKLKKEADNLEKYIIGVEKKLSNKSFVDNAPKEVVEAEQKKMNEAKAKLDKIKEQL